MMSYSCPFHTLTCVSTGGPATKVTWRKDGVIISPSSPSHQQSQRVVDTTTATYHNLLSITSSDISDYNGSFNCTVNNTRGNSQPMSLDINGIYYQCIGTILYYFLLAIQLLGNKTIYRLGSSISVICSSNLTVQSIRWLSASSNNETILLDNSSVQKLVLTIDRTTTAINNTMYTCEINVNLSSSVTSINESFSLLVDRK